MNSPRGGSQCRIKMTPQKGRAVEEEDRSAREGKSTQQRPPLGLFPSLPASRVAPLIHPTKVLDESSQLILQTLIMKAAQYLAPLSPSQTYTWLPLPPRLHLCCVLVWNGVEGELTGQSPISQEAIFLKLLRPLSPSLSLPHSTSSWLSQRCLPRLLTSPNWPPSLGFCPSAQRPGC